MALQHIIICDSVILFILVCVYLKVAEEVLFCVFPATTVFLRMAIPELLRPQYLVDSAFYRLHALVQKLGCRRSSRFVCYFPSERTPFSAACFPIWNQEKTSHSGLFFSFSSIRTLFDFDHSLHFCVSWFYGWRWHCRRQRALGSGSLVVLLDVLK